MVADLVSMGFNQSRARRALKFFRNNVAIATDHLLSSNEEMDDLVVDISQGSKRTLLGCISPHLFKNKIKILEWGV